MKDRVQAVPTGAADIGVKGQLQEWADIDWRAVKKHVKNLRQRIYRATQKQQWNKVRSLKKLLLRHRLQVKGLRQLSRAMIQTQMSRFFAFV